MEIQFNGKRAIVTGAGKGIGRGIATKLAACGAEVFALGRTKSDLDSLKSEVPTINIVQIDLQDWHKTREALKTIGPVDLLVNNAAIIKLAPFLETKKEDLQDQMEINFNGVFNVSQVVANHMVEKGSGGSIVHISSISAQIANGPQMLTVYCCSKAALDMLTKCMALELGPHNIRVNSVNPGFVWTEMSRNVWSAPEKAEEFEQLKKRYPLGKFAEIDDVVNSVLFLLSDKCPSTHGINMKIDSGRCVH